MDGSWEDETLVFDATKDEWEWPSDDAFSSVKVKPSEVDEQVDEEEEETESVPTTDDGLSPPMHSLGTSVKVSASRYCVNDVNRTSLTCRCVAVGLVCCRCGSGMLSCGSGRV